MNIVIVSESSSKAASRCAKLLDSYAVRIGSRTWATPITEEALSELRRALAVGASRNTAVACYRNDGRASMKLLWIVGSHSHFGQHGAVPVKTMKISAPEELPGWIRTASLSGQAAGFAHDFGKYSEKFQLKLRGKAEPADGVRHEWISIKLFQLMRECGQEDLKSCWREAWSKLKERVGKNVFGSREISNNDRSAVYGALEAVDFLIACHHGLLDDPYHPTPSQSGDHFRIIKNYWDRDPRIFKPFDCSLPESACRKLKSILDRLLEQEKKIDFNTTGIDPSLYWRSVLIYARAALIFADHCVSAQKIASGAEQASGELVKDDKWRTGVAYANTCKVSGGGVVPNQTLEWHLDRVSGLAADTVWRMARLSSREDVSLPGLEPYAMERIRNTPPSSDPRYAWQDKAAAKLEEVADKSGTAPVLVFDLAGTGCGKTRMNVRSACVLAKSTAPRVTVALNLRTLTLQTGAAIEKQMGLDANDLATVIGDSATTLLFKKIRQLQDGGESEEPEKLFDAEGGTWSLPEWLDGFFAESREKKIIGAPLLVSTIDFIVAAGEPATQGHHVKALLRLMSSDLILDEIDSYEPDALVAVLRLVQLSAFFGRNVICSSATLPKSVASATEAAFGSGVRMRRALDVGQHAGLAYSKVYIDNLVEPEAFYLGDVPEQDDGKYGCHLEAMIAAMAKLKPIRVAAPAYLNEQNPASWLDAVADAVRKLHNNNHIVDPKTKTKISFGLVRVANISHAVRTADYLSEKMPEARVACYHANDWLIARFNKERRLDFLLSRQHGDGHIFRDSEIRALIDEAHAQGVEDLRFIVVATPVEETGRDHDFDWAVIDASSAQSIVQTAGRVNRHRSLEISSPNIMIPNFNFRHCCNCVNDKTKCNQAFVWPGFESFSDSLRGEHDLSKILPWKHDKSDLWLPIDATLRLASCVDSADESTKPSPSLAANDEKAVKKELDKYFSYAGKHTFTFSPVPATLMARKIYEQTPLRCRKGTEDVFRLDFGGADGTLSVIKRLEFPRTNPRGEWVEKEPCVVPDKPRSNAWLSLTPLEMRCLCQEMGLSEDQGMIARLRIYGDGHENVSWKFDRDFGICRQ